jgi:hypothetical protein
LGLRVKRLAKHRDQDETLWITTAANERDETDVADKVMRMLTTFAPVGQVASDDVVDRTVERWDSIDLGFLEDEEDETDVA